MRLLTGSRRTLLTALAASALWPKAQGMPRRIVSIGGAITETLYALGAQDELVGVDTTSLHPAAARALPNVGYARQLSAEGVLSLRPTLVIAGEEAGPPSVLRALEAARVPLAVLEVGHRFEGVVERSLRIAALCSRDAQGQALVQQLKAAWHAARDRVGVLSRNVTAPRALFLLSHAAGQIRVAGRETAAHAMLGYAGAINVFGDAFTGYKPLTPEAAIAAAPQVVVATEQGVQATGGIDGLLKAPGLAQTPAGQARRVIALDALLLLGFGPRLPQAVAALAEAMFVPPTR